MKDIFSENDRERIREAVGRAETTTSGEIVPVVVSASDSYEVALWKGAALAAALALTVAMLIFHFYHGWGFGWLHTGWGMAFATIAAGIVGGLVGAFVPPAKRVLTGSDDMARTVHRRAMKAFVDEEVFTTRDRTGILIFISLLEHRIEVLGDAGINEVVSPDEWADVIEQIRRGIRSGRVADGLVEAIESCGHLLETRGVHVRKDDVDELSNELRIQKGH